MMESRGYLSTMETDRQAIESARASLAQVQAGRRAAARRVVTPWWFHPLLGTALAAMFAAFSLRGPAVWVVVALSLVAQFALYVLYRRLTGLWVNTWRIGSTRRVTAAATAVAFLVVYVGVWLDLGVGVRGAAAAGGVLLGFAYVVFWRWVDRRLAELWSEPE